MAIWPLILGYAGGYLQDHDITRYYPVAGDLDFDEIEAQVQTLVRDSYTLANLEVRITGNTMAAATTVRSRINGGNGTQSVSIGAGATGIFTDAVNSDALVSGDLINSVVITPESLGAWIKTSIIAYTLTNSTCILACVYAPGTLNEETEYYPVGGFLSGDTVETTAQYRYRVAATLSNFRIYASENTLDGETTARVRVNGANGNQVVTVGAGLTGGFEDAENTDVIAAGNLLNYQAIAGGTGLIRLSVMQVKVTSTGQHLMQSRALVGLKIYGRTRYLAITGNLQIDSTTEAHAQSYAKATLTGKNMFVRVETNTLDGVATIRTRKNGANGNLSVSVPAGNSGEFEDLENSDSYVATDEINWQTVTGGGSGSIGLNIIGLEINQAAAGWTGKISGVSNPAKVMGVPVANIAKVKGVA